MVTTNEFTRVTSLIAEPARAMMLWSLLDGRAYTAGELAIAAGVSPQSASNHLTKLANHQLVSIEKQGRHRYYKIANPQVAYVIESIANLIPVTKQDKIRKPTCVSDIGFARTCYDHLAGEIGVKLTASMLNQGWLIVENKNYQVTNTGIEQLLEIGIDSNALKKSKRSFAHQCLDWSERKHHLAGALGAAILSKLLAFDWIRRKKHSRAVIITHLGQQKLYEHFKI